MKNQHLHKQLFRVCYFSHIPLLIILSFYSGCKNLPQKNDVYENLLTKDRIKIDNIGTGNELKDIYEGMNSILDTLISDKNIKLSMLRFPVLGAEDSSKNCIAYEDKMIVSGHMITCIRIISVERLKKDYRVVN